MTIGTPAGTHKNKWTLRMKFRCARNTPNLKRRENACHCRLSDCEHVGTYSVSRNDLFGDVREGRTSPASSSCVGGRSRERSSELRWLAATVTDPPHSPSRSFSFSLLPFDNRRLFFVFPSSASLHRLNSVLSLSYEVGSVDTVVGGE